MDDSGDAGFEFIAPSSLADAKNKIAKMMMFYLGDIGREFDVGDKKTLTIVEKSAVASDLDRNGRTNVETLVKEYEINEDTLTLNDYLLEE